MPKRDEVTLSEDQTKWLQDQLRKLLAVRNRLDALNKESKALRKFLKSNGEEIAVFLQAKQLKSCKAEGTNVRAIEKTIKVKPTPEQIFATILEMYNNPEMIEQVKQRVIEKYVTPKQHKKTVLKLVKTRPKKTTQQQPSPNPEPQ